MIEIGRLIIKTAGRDAGKKAVIIDIIDNNYVLIDGETRRRKCNISHLEPLETKIEVKKGASHEDVKKAFEALGLKVKEIKQKEKKEKPVKQRKIKAKEEITEKPKKEKTKEKKKEEKAKGKVEKKEKKK